MISQALDYTIEAVERLADVKFGTTAGSRHQRPDAITAINDAYREYQTMLVSQGFDLFVTESSPAALPTTAETSEDYSLITLPTGLASLQRVDVLLSGRWYAAEHVEWSQLRQFNREQYGFSRRIAFSVKSAGSVTGSSEVAGTVAIAPFLQGSYKLSYLPEQAVVTTETDVFRFQNAYGFKWVVYEVVAGLTIRDRDSSGHYDMAVRERAEAKKSIGAAVPVTVSTGSTTTVRSRNYR